MPGPHVWLKAAIEDATGYQAWPVEMTGSGAPPYIVYARESTTREQLLPDTMEAVPEPDYLPPLARFQVVTYADSYVQAWEIADEISAAVHKVSTEDSGLTINTVVVADERDGDAGYLEGREQPTYTVEQSIEIRWE
jgi:hypothetical protein